MLIFGIIKQTRLENERNGKMKGFVDKNTCIGCGLCPTICPDIFRMDDDGLAVAEDIEIPDNILADAQEAAESCPVAAITVDNM